MHTHSGRSFTLLQSRHCSHSRVSEGLMTFPRDGGAARNKSSGSRFSLVNWWLAGLAPRTKERHIRPTADLDPLHFMREWLRSEGLARLASIVSVVISPI